MALSCRWYTRLTGQIAHRFTEGNVLRRLALELRQRRGELDPCGQAHSISVLKAIKREVTAAKAKMNIPMKNLWLAQGVCDESGELREGEVLIANGDIVGPVIVWRSPCPHPGDVRKLMAVAGRPHWTHLRNNIVFSVQGSRPASDEMAKGDYDGDRYYILPAVEGTLLKEIVAFAEPEAPAIYAVRNPASDEALQAAAAVDAALQATTAFSPSTAARPPASTLMVSPLRLHLERKHIVSESASSWLRAVDLFGVASTEAKALGSVHERALNARATGGGDTLQLALDEAKQCFVGKKQGQPKWMPNGRCSTGRIYEGKNKILGRIADRYGEVIAEVEERIKMLVAAQGDPTARRAAVEADKKVVRLVKEKSRYEEPAAARSLAHLKNSGDERHRSRSRSVSFLLRHSARLRSSSVSPPRFGRDAELERSRNRIRGPNAEPLRGGASTARSKPLPSREEIDSATTSILAATGTAELTEINEACCRGERLLLAMAGENLTSKAATLARYVRDARLKCCEIGNDEAARNAVRKAWHVQRAALTPALDEARCQGPDKASRATLKIAIDNARDAFRVRLHPAMESGRLGTTHALLMSLGDLERYRETCVDTDGTDRTERKAENYYGGALRLRPENGLCAGNIGTLEMARRRWGAAAHWLLRASLASEPYADAQRALRKAAGFCARTDSFETVADAEKHLAAAAAAVAAGTDASSDDVRQIIVDASRKAVRALRRDAQNRLYRDKEGLAREVTTAVIVARSAATTCNAELASAACSAARDICAAALEGASVSARARRHAAPAGLVVLKWLAGTTDHAPKCRAADALAELAVACADDARFAEPDGLIIVDDLNLSGVFNNAPAVDVSLIFVSENEEDTHAERARRIVSYDPQSARRRQAPQHVRRVQARAPLPEHAPLAIPVSDAPISRGDVLEALAVWVGGSPDRSAKSGDCANFLAVHRERLGTDVVPIGVDWLTPRILAPYGLGKRYENASTFWLVARAPPQVSLEPVEDVPSQKSSPFQQQLEAENTAVLETRPCPKTRKKQKSRRHPSQAVATEDQIDRFMTALRRYIDQYGQLTGGSVNNFTQKLPPGITQPRPLKVTVERHAEAYGLRLETRPAPAGWVVILRNSPSGASASEAVTGDDRQTVTGDVAPATLLADQQRVVAALADWVRSMNSRIRSDELETFFSQHPELPRFNGVRWLTDELLEKNSLRRIESHSPLGRSGHLFYLKVVPLLTPGMIAVEKSIPSTAPEPAPAHSFETVARILAHLGEAHLLPTFEAELISDDTLPLLEPSDLIDLGIAPATCRAILGALAERELPQAHEESKDEQLPDSNTDCNTPKATPMRQALAAHSSATPRSALAPSRPSSRTWWGCWGWRGPCSG